MFNKVNAGRVSTLIAEQIRLLVRSGELTVGDRLPSERERGEQFGVSRVTVRGAHLAAGGVPVYARTVLVRTRPLGAEVVAAMGERPVVLMRGHGLTAVGDDPADAVLRAASDDILARMTLAVASAGGAPAPVPAADLAELPDLGARFTRATAWRHELARVGRDGAAWR